MIKPFSTFILWPIMHREKNVTYTSITQSIQKEEEKKWLIIK